MRARFRLRHITSWCAFMCLPYGLVLADDLPPVVLADAARQSPDDPGWSSQFMEQSRRASSEAISKCAQEGKVPLGNVWQNSTLQLLVTYKCVPGDDPKFKAARTAPPTITAVAPGQAEKTCAAQGKRAKEFGLRMLTFYACVSSAQAHD
jgi:hypothetical protein